MAASDFIEYAMAFAIFSGGVCGLIYTIQYALRRDKNR